MQDRRIARGYPPRKKVVLYLLPPEGDSSSKTGPCVRIRGKVGRLLCPPHTAAGDAAADIQNQASHQPLPNSTCTPDVIHRPSLTQKRKEKFGRTSTCWVESAATSLLPWEGERGCHASVFAWVGCTLQSQVHTCQLSSRSSSALSFLFGKPRDHYRHSTAATTHLPTNLEASLLCDRVELPAPPLLSPNKKQCCFVFKKVRLTGPDRTETSRPAKKRYTSRRHHDAAGAPWIQQRAMLFFFFAVSFVFFGSSMFESERATRCPRLRRGPRRGRGQRGSAAQKRMRISQDPVDAVRSTSICMQPRGGSKNSRTRG